MKSESSSKPEETDADGILNRRSRHISLKGPLGNVYADYRDSGKQSLGAGGVETAKKALKRTSAVALTTGWDALETGRNVLSSVGEVVKLFQAEDEHASGAEKMTKIAQSRTLQNKTLKPIRYGDLIMLSTELATGGSGGETHRGMFAGDPAVSRRGQLLLFSDPSEIDTVNMCVYQIVKPGCCLTGDEVDISKSHGDVLHYGKCFALRNKLIGGEFLCHEENKRSDIEKNFNRLGFCTVLGPQCYFTFVPKFQSRSKDSVYYGDDILISHSGGYFMHAGGLNSALGAGLEASDYGCTTQLDVNWARLREIESGACVWQAAEYACYDDIGSGFLTAGSPIRLFQPELGAYLIANCSASPSHVFQGTNRRHNSIVIDQHSAILEIDPPVFSRDTRNHSGENHAFIEDVMGNGVFVVEKLSPLIGGTVDWGEPVRLRHLSTSSYLSANRAPHSDESETTFKVPFCVSLCRLLDHSDDVSRAQFLQDTMFFLQSASRTGDDDDMRIKLPVRNLRLKHVYQQSEYSSKHLKKDESALDIASLPYFMRVRRRFESELKKVRTEVFDARSRDNVVETILSFGDDIVLKIPQYPEIVTSGTNDTMSELERAQRVSELADKYTTVSKIALFLDDVNDADVLQLIPVSTRDHVNTEVGVIIARLFHDFEAALIIFAAKVKNGLKYSVKHDIVHLMHTVLNDMMRYSSSEELKYETDDTRVLPKEDGNTLETAYDREIAIKRQQQHIMDDGLLDRLFWLFRSPVYLDISWPVIYRHKTLLQVFQKIKLTICCVCDNNPVVQEYVAHSAYLGTRAKADEVPESATANNIGYISEIFAHLYVDEEGASKMLEASVSRNRELLSALFDEDVTESIVGLIQLKGAKPSVLRLLGSMANAGSKPMIPNQRLLLDLMYSLSDDQRYIQNRRRLLMETSATTSSRPILYGKNCSRSITVEQHKVCISWYGTSQALIGDGVSALFQRADSLGLEVARYDESLISIPQHLRDYFDKLSCSEGDREWTSLQAIAWCIDPANCFEFSKPGTFSKSAWATRLIALNRDPEKIKKFRMIRKVVLYYGAILDFFERMTADRSFDSVEVLEQQFCPELLFSGVGDEELPLFFRYRFGALLRNIFVDRYPHRELSLPDLIRAPEQIKGIHSLDSALPTYVCTSRPKMNELGEISFAEPQSGVFMSDTSLTKFERIQCIIGQYFLGSSFALHVDASCALGSLIPQSPSSRLGASEVDSYRFSYLLLEIAHLLVRRGFYHSEGLLLQVIHIAYGVLHSHVYCNHASIKDSQSVALPSTTVGTGKAHEKPVYSALPSEDDSADAEELKPAVGAEIEMAQTNNANTAESSPMDYMPFRGLLVSKVKDRINAIHGSGHPQDSEERKVLSKSGDLANICHRHDKATRSMSRNPLDGSTSNAKLIVVFENQRHAVKWVPVVSVHRDRFHCEDKYVRQLFTTTTPEESLATEGGLPPDALWKWVDEWHVNPDAGGGIVSLDVDGWVYAFNWPSNKKGFSPSMGANHFVRRRKWERTREVRTATEVAELLLNRGFSEQVILAAFRKAMSSGGVIDFEEVLRTIKSVAELEEKKMKLLQTSKAVACEGDEDSTVGLEEDILSEYDRGILLTRYSKLCSSEALGILSYTYVISTDARVTSFYSIIRESITSNSPLWSADDSSDEAFNARSLRLTSHGQKLTKRLFSGGKLSTLDCVGLSDGNCVEKFMSFVMNEDHSVCSLALDVLREHFQQVNNFTEQLSRVIYCSGTYLYFHYLLARSLVPQLSSLLEMYWIRESITTISVRLIEIFDELTKSLSGGDNNESRSEAQDILRALHAHELALKTLHMDIDTFKTMGEQQKTSSKPLWKAICLFLCEFVKNNDTNISLVALSFSTGNCGIGSGFYGSDSIVLLFGAMSISHQKALDHMPAQRLYSNVLEEFSERLYEIPNLHDYTTLLMSSLFNSDRTYEVLNQNFLIRKLLSKRFISLVLLYNDSEMQTNRMSIVYRKNTGVNSGVGINGMTDMDAIIESECYKERKVLMKQYCELSPTSQKASSGVYCTRLVYYHAACVELLAECAGGRNYGNASKCAELLSFETVVAVLLEIAVCPCYPILKAFSKFMIHVFIAAGAADSALDDSFLESPLLYEVLVQFCANIKSISVDAWQQCVEGEGLRGFVLDGALPLFRAYFAVEVESVDLRRTEVASFVQDLVSHLQNLPREIFTQVEIRKIGETVLAFGMPEVFVGTAVNPPESLSANNFEVENPLKSKNKKFRLGNNRKQNAAETGSWGDSAVRFSELPLLLETCPYITELREREIDKLVDFMLKGYGVGGGDDPGGVVGADSMADRNSERGSSKEDGVRKSTRTIETNPLSSQSRSEKSVRENEAARANFAATVGRLIKFAREEVDVLVSKSVSLNNSASKQGLEKLKRETAPGSTEGLSFYGAPADIDDGALDSEIVSPKLCHGDSVTSKNIPFVFRIIAKCLARFRENAECEEQAARLENVTSSFGAATELEDVQELLAGTMVPSLIAEVIGGCPYTVVLSVAFDLGIELLTNGNKKCQDVFLWHLRSIEPSEAAKFFRTYTEIMALTAKEYANIRVERDEYDQASSSTGSRQIKPVEAIRGSKQLQKKYCVFKMLEFLRLLNEGHNLDVQNIMENQAGIGLKESSTLLSHAVLLLESYLPSTASILLLTIADARLILKTFDFLAEAVQGPCLVNQEILVKSSIQSVVQRLLDFTAHIEHRSDVRNHVCWRGKYGLDSATLKGLRVGGLQLLLSLLEGRQPNRVVSDPVFSEMSSSFDYSSIPKKLSEIMDERHSAVVRLRRSFEKSEEIQALENQILEEGFLLLALGRQVAAHSDQVAMDLVPILPPPVKKNKYPSAAEAAEAEKQRKGMERVVKAFAEFDERLRSVEISWSGLGLFKFNFILPTECRYLTEESKRSIIQNIDFGDDDRVKFFLQKTSSIHDDVSHQKTLQNKWIFILLMRFQDELDYATAFLAILINFILIISLEKGYLSGNADPVYEPRSYQYVVQILVIFQVAVLLYKLVQTSILTLPLIYKESLRVSHEISRAQGKNSDANRGMKDIALSFGPLAVQTTVCLTASLLIRERYSYVPYPVIALMAIFLGNSSINALDSFARSPWNSEMRNAQLIIALAASMGHSELQYRCICAIVGVLALNVHRPYFCSLMLLVIVKLSITLQNVVRAVTLPRVALFLSSVLGLIMIFIFSIFAFYLFPNEFYNEDQYTDECSTLLLCLTTFLHGGLLSGGGIADHVSGELGHPPLYADSENYSSRVTYDVFFFVIIIVLLLNIIFGIIIDTFGKLREDASEKKRLQNDYCFICGISRDTFETIAYDKKESAGSSGFSSAFESHIKTEHNMWDYVFFLIYLKTKNPNNYLGIESFVATKVKSDDVTWIPRGKALAIPDTQEEEQHAVEERLMDKIKSIMDSAQRVISAGVVDQTNRLQEENRNLRQQVGAALQSVSYIQATLEEVKSAQAVLQDTIVQQKKK